MITLSGMCHGVGFITRMVAAIASLAALVAPAAAQVRQLDLPAPITSERFDEWVQWLDVSHEEHVAAEAAHERYKESWRRFRAAVIDRALEEIYIETAQLEDRDRRPLPDAFDELVANVCRGQQGLEHALFSELRGLLSDDAARIEQLELRREWDYIGNEYDLAGLARDLGLDADVMEEIEPLLMTARKEIVAAGRKVHSKIEHLRGAGARALREAGYVELHDWPSEESTEQRRIREQSWDANEPLIRDVEREFETLLIGWARRIEAALPQEARREYRMMWGTRLYDSVYLPIWESVGYRSREIESRDDITAEQRQSVEQLKDEFLAAIASAEEEMMEIVDQMRLIPSRQDERWRPLAQRRNELYKTIEAGARGLWEQMSKVVPRQYDHESDEGRALAARMARWELDLILDGLGFDDNARSIALEIFRVYSERCTVALRAATEELDGIRPGEFGNEVVADRKRAVRQDVQLMIARLDEQLIADLFALAPDSDGMDAFFREVRRANRCIPESHVSGRWRYRLVHPFEALATAGLSNDSVRAAIMEARHFALTIRTLVEKRHALLMDYSHRLVLAQEARDREVARGNETAGVRMKPWEDEVEQLDIQFTDICLRAHAIVETSLPPVEAHRYVESWRKLAYPSLAGGPDVSAEVEAALGLRGLSDEERFSILSVLEDHWSDRESCFHQCIRWTPEIQLTEYERMAERSLPRVGTFSQGTVQAKYDAIEAAATTLRSVRALLTAEQAAEWDAIIASSE